MGWIFPCCRNKDFNIILVGLDGAGKTTVFNHLKPGEKASDNPTLGFNVSTICYKQLSFTLWDLGGKKKYRTLWKHYYSNTVGVIFVIDSSNKERIDEAAKELSLILDESQLHDAAVLVLANKQDKREALSLTEVQAKLDKRLKERTSCVQGTSALNGQGANKGFNWISEEIYKAHY